MTLPGQDAPVWKRQLNEITLQHEEWHGEDAQKPVTCGLLQHKGKGAWGGVNTELQGATICSGGIGEACGWESLWKLVNTEKPHLSQEVPDRKYLEIGRISFWVSGANATYIHPALILHFTYSR